MVGEKGIDEDAFIVMQQIHSARPEVLHGEFFTSGFVFFNCLSLLYDVNVFRQLAQAAGVDAGGEGCEEEEGIKLRVSQSHFFYGAASLPVAIIFDLSRQSHRVSPFVSQDMPNANKANVSKVNTVLLFGFPWARK